jgi:hypothetical protein
MRTPPPLAPASFDKGYYGEARSVGEGANCNV